MKKPYKDGVKLFDIIEDGWCRGFLVQQTLQEAATMGYEVTDVEIMEVWSMLDLDYKEQVRKEFYE